MTKTPDRRPADAEPALNIAKLAPPDAPHIDRSAVRRYDTIALRHPSRRTPVPARVTAVGAHGVTVRGPNGHRLFVRWQDVVGHAPAIQHDVTEDVAGLPDPDRPSWENAPVPLVKDSPRAVTYSAPFQKSHRSEALVRGAVHAERMPEQYLRELGASYAQALRDAFDQILDAVTIWIEHRPQVLDKARATPAPRPISHPTVLTPDDVEELADLIRHFLIAQITGLPVQMPTPQRRGWLAWRLHSQGVIPSQAVDLSRYMREAFVLGRLQAILRDAQSLQDALQMASALPLPRPIALAMVAAQESAGNYVTGWGDGLVGLMRQTCLESNQTLLGSLISAYLAGDLKSALTSPPGLTLAEQALVNSNQSVTSPRALALDLRRRWGEQHDDRDWDRLALSEVRRLSNIGALEGMAEAATSSGKDLATERVYYLVAPGACDLCKRVYLDEQGRPRTFALSDLLETIRSTGGIDRQDKTRPNALLHPWDACKPMRVTALGMVRLGAAPLMITRGRTISKEQLR